MRPKAKCVPRLDPGPGRKKRHGMVCEWGRG